ncbi:mitochondrial ATPase inhibitor, IATP-domain-containing protein [Talaromyces proteolyticus]|uniref:ATPase inhibitor, mitochondrial n=1 Tax=Talaromyces proteolyticus TaxID=1131652 RepID=A0AAD4KVE6_9EURO|nr:mitochondrial ATPase inhibitor, IATP-domain-containing protein [Talaromyces proteolyticus]KAH8700308.1 mitochondrial ATPase inhibitor, IATP-domain-containing protein [Talaromyces proteolyticus]
MFRNSVSRPLLRVNQTLVARRSFSAVAVRMAEGDTGAPRPGGVQSSDSFTKREAASESMYVKEKELEKLKQLKAKLKEQRRHLDELDKHIDELTKEQGGEKN